MERTSYFDLEDPRSLTQLAEPMTALEGLRGLIVIDEVQRRPDLFPVLRVLADRRPLPARFLILGSASPELLRQSTESLAGRIEIIEMGGFSLPEIGARHLARHWLRGGFPLSYTARSLGVAETTARRYLDLLSGVYMTRQLVPWHENLGKRQVKSPKVYVRDTGLLHHLLGIASENELLAHPKCGASWEGYAIEEVIDAAQPDDTYFWATHQGAELDLLLFKNGRRLGVEVKRMDAPKLTPSMRSALEDLKLEQLVVLYPGLKEYALAERVRVVPLAKVAEAGVREIFPQQRRVRANKVIKRT